MEPAGPSNTGLAEAASLLSVAKTRSEALRKVMAPAEVFNRGCMNREDEDGMNRSVQVRSSAAG